MSFGVGILSVGYHKNVTFSLTSSKVSWRLW